MVPPFTQLSKPEDPRLRPLTHPACLSNQKGYPFYALGLSYTGLLPFLPLLYYCKLPLLSEVPDFCYIAILP